MLQQSRPYLNKSAWCGSEAMKEAACGGVRMPQASSRCCRAPQAGCATSAQISLAVPLGLQTGGRRSDDCSALLPATYQECQTDLSSTDAALQKNVLPRPAVMPISGWAG